MTLELTSRPPSTAPPIEADDGPPGAVARTVTAFIVGLPFVALVLAVIRFRGHGIELRDVVLAVVLYLLIGHGVTIGYHRLLAHKAFTACRPLKVALATLGSMAFEGGPIGWVASHRRHHVFADTPDDPHSPQHLGGGLGGELKGLWHAHVGWLFTARGVPTSRHAADLLADRDIVVIDKLFPVLSVASLAVPFGLGWLLGGTLGAAFSALLWAGLVRIFLLHHANVERQLAVPHVRPAAVRVEGPQHQCSRARHRQHGRVLAQRASRLPPLGPSRPVVGPVGHLGDADQPLREAWVDP